MSAFHLIAPKLAKFLLLLGSDKDGEVLGAARAIGRALEAKDLDFHDFAGALDSPEPPPGPPRSHARPPDPNQLRRAQERVQGLLLEPETLRANEIEFLRSIRGRLVGGQSEWLDAIYARSSREYAR